MSNSEQSKDDSQQTSTSESAKYRIYSQEEAFIHMTQPRPESQQQLYLLIDDVLFYNWDALCLSVDEDYREEYLPYLPHVFDLLLNTDDGTDIYEYLLSIENTESDSSKSDNLAKQRATRVVEILLEYRSKILSKENNTITTEV